MDFLDPKSVLNLDHIRHELVRMEDTIIFNFIERSYFPTCPVVYHANHERLPLPDFDGSFLDWAHMHMEMTQSQLRRFEAPDQVPFYPGSILPPILPPVQYPKLLAPYAPQINYNDRIKAIYLDSVVPLVSLGEGTSWENLGSVTSCDIDCLQALSRRIHFGKFVAEAKFQLEPEKYTALIKNRDVDGIMDSITNKFVEDKILKRLQAKATVYGVDPLDRNCSKRVTPEYLAKIYKEYVIPITKEVEVEYLLRRLEGEDL
ncbi:ADL326Wp [Eremothecium gossypii ATCC 10895]|uniref:Chorismate mutase n=1 Tax=Eremothecium gossypii (strain ATCC 10895 / CBS 109.51 / FGSC 9923 / NRRL Y-1056) TaxID=284811 RepID=Q75BG5_EREGS|nr:ADL326Wp [Eremothecium gossypii ATCC 10895]AAS51594.1 ADL326Wp [Eremothecium gossypii ATCC 10895]AEY95890.1 FADL326Wp [Eremothecium gossypii FDAG1]